MVVRQESDEGQVSVSKEPVEQREVREAPELIGEDGDTLPEMAEDAGEVGDDVADSTQEPKEDSAAQNAEEMASEEQTSNAPKETKRKPGSVRNRSEKVES